MLCNLNLLLSIPTFTHYDDNDTGNDGGDDGGDDSNTDKNPPPVNKKKITFDADQQTELNRLLSEERRKAGLRNQATVTQLEELRKVKGLTDVEKEGLETRIEELRTAHLTEKELADREKKKSETKYKTDLDGITKDRDNWKGRYHGEKIKTALQSAATGEKAYNTDVVVTLLTPDSRLIEEMDDEGKPTGELVPRVKIKQKDKEGKTTILDLSPVEAVKVLKDDDSFANLFISSANGGFGGGNNPNRRGNSDQPPTDPMQYRLWRKANPEKVGAPAVRKN